MKLQGLHHITMVTGDAQANVDFYADALGLRLVKKTVNFDQPEAYHLYFGDEHGSPGSILTWFEFAGAAPGRAGTGMIHTIELAVPDAAALAFWETRLGDRDVSVTRTSDRLRFADPDGLAVELVASGPTATPLRAEHPDVPAAHAIAGLAGARAYSAAPIERDRVLTDVLGFVYEGEGRYRVEGDARTVRWAYEPAPAERGVPGAGTVHHIAWATPNAEHLAWQSRVREAGAHVTDVQDRDYFDAIYFREPRGVLFEIATLDPGFATDETPDRLGEALRLPTQHEPLRSELERRLRPVVNPRTARRDGATA